MNKNRIEGRYGTTSWHNTAKSSGLPVEVNAAVVLGSITLLWDGEFSENSFGFREGRNAHQAVRLVEGAWKLNRRHAVDCDLKAFFDTVKHDPLLVQLREKIGGGKLLRLIGRYLRAGVELPDGTYEATPLGVPQGGPLSPLLANIVLDPLDKELTRRGHVFARYADDFELLRDQPYLPLGVRDRRMDEKASQVILLETMEKTWPAKAKPAKVGGEPQEGSHGNAEPKRILAHES